MKQKIIINADSYETRIAILEDDELAELLVERAEQRRHVGDIYKGRVNAVLPPGLSVLAFRPILFKTPSLMSQLEGASYRVRFPRSFLEDSGLAPESLHEVLETRIPELLGREHVIVRRRSEAQTREFDARPCIVALEVRGEDPPCALDVHVRFTARAQARPDELIALLIPNADARTADVERTMLWSEIGGHRLDPLALLSART